MQRRNVIRWFLAKNTTFQGHFLDPLLDHFLAISWCHEAREKQVILVKNRGKIRVIKGSKITLKQVILGHFWVIFGPSFFTGLFKFRSPPIWVTQKRGPKSGQKVVKKWSKSGFFDPFFATFFVCFWVFKAREKRTIS